MNYWPEYVPVAEKKNKAIKKIAALRKKGQKVYPIVVTGRTITRTFWGKAWCAHLESYSDYENRLPRGRSYVRNNAVIDLKIKKGSINALVSGSSLYTVNITIQNLDNIKWKKIIKKCAGKIDSLIELLQGKFSDGIMKIITDKNQGLFPLPSEINFDCSCPDHANMCKHVAATLYGMGVRLDEEPEKLFLLRHIDHLELINAAQSSEKFTAAIAAGKGLDEGNLSSLFGIEFDTTNKTTKTKKAKKVKTAKSAKATLQKKSPKKAVAKKAKAKKQSKVTTPGLKAGASQSKFECY